MHGPLPAPTRSPPYASHGPCALQHHTTPTRPCPACPAAHPASLDPARPRPRSRALTLLCSKPPPPPLLRLQPPPRLRRPAPRGRGAATPQCLTLAALACRRPSAPEQLRTGSRPAPSLARLAAACTLESLSSPRTGGGATALLGRRPSLAALAASPLSPPSFQLGPYVAATRNVLSRFCRPCASRIKPES